MCSHSNRDKSLCAAVVKRAVLVEVSRVIIREKKDIFSFRRNNRRYIFFARYVHTNFLTVTHKHDS